MENIKRTPHKWVKEIQSWADGHQVERKCRADDDWCMDINSIDIFDNPDCEFRIYDPLREVKEDLKVGDWVTPIIDFEHEDGVEIKSVFKVENIRNHLTFHTSDGIFYKTDFRKATKQEVLNAPNYDGTATSNDFEIEVGDWVSLSISEPFKVDRLNLEQLSLLPEHVKSAFAYVTKQEIEKVTNKTVKTGRNNSMRATGKTTRLINEAIEQLFLYGKILVPINSQYEKITSIGNYIGFPIIIEQDRTDDNTQKELFDKIIARLELEHKGQFEVEKKIIKLKDRE